MILFYYGEDTWTLEREIKNLKADFENKYSRSGIEELILQNQSDEELRSRLQESLESQGLFSTRKLVILKNFLGEINKSPLAEEYLLKKLPTVGETVEVVFEQSEDFDKRLKFYKALQKPVMVREFVVPAGRDLEVWIKNYLAAQNFEMPRDALVEFVNLLGGNTDEQLYDLWQVSQELEKLMLWTFSQEIITADDVRAIVKPNITENIFSLTNLFAEGKTGEAMRLLEKMIGDGPAAELKTQFIQIIGGLASQIRSLLLVKDLESQSSGQIVKTLNWKEGRVWINLKLAKKFTKEKLLNLLTDLRALDLRLKTSEEPPKLLLTLFFQKAKV